jgi:hypothetical protein
MAESQPPKDVLALGQHLVRELGFSNHRDTLGRWMAHHIAELIDKAKNGSSSAERAKSRKIATETILKIWEHRTSLPGDAYPLKSYENILKVLDLLRPDGNPFKRFGNHAGAKRKQLAALLFDRLSRLVVAILLMDKPFRRTSANVEIAAIKALSETEQQVLKALQQWGDLFVSETKSSKRGRKSKKSNALKVNLKEVADGLIDSITSTLVELRSELEKTPAAQKRGTLE